MDSPDTVNAFLNNIYYDPSKPGSFGGVQKLYRVAKKAGKNYRMKDIRSWLEDQETYYFYKPQNTKFERSKVVVKGIGEMADADLADVAARAKYNDGVRFLLVYIDVFSRFLTVEPCSSKKAVDMLKTFEILFQRTIPCKLLRTDAGAEFLNKEVQQFFQSVKCTSLYRTQYRD